MAQCETGKNRMKALLPGVPVEHKTGTLNGLADDVGFLTMPDGHRVAVAIFTRGGTDRPRTIAEAAKRSTTGSSPPSPGRSAPALTAQIVLLHIVARGKIGRSPEADLVERYLKRIAWPTKVTELPDRGGKMPELAGNSVIDRARRARAGAVVDGAWRRSSNAGATAASAKRGS